MTDSAPQHLFVAGLHRSGTTLLARWIADHPAVSGLSGTGTMLDEGQFLQDVFPSDVEHGGPGRFGFDPRAHLTENAALLSAHNRETLQSQWAKYWEPGKLLWLEKSPSNILRARFLQAIFPEARFVFLLRHPIAVTLATHKWSQTSFFSLIANWVHVHQLHKQDLQYLNHWLVMAYESLIYAPEAATQRLQDF
ncbi:MAG: sulfotransferase, partial [Symploca sp. SIO2B6]|nr:sulfotransferase [Symploca sp. SIO2B6]